MGQFVGDLPEEELHQLRPVGSGDLGGVGDVLDDGAELASQVLVEFVD
jgi:hypothetical protein